MKCYEPSIPRAKLGIAALALTAITMSVMVVLPATLDSPDAGRVTLAAAGIAAGAPTDGNSHLARADVAAVELGKQLALRSHGRFDRR